MTQIDDLVDSSMSRSCSIWLISSSISMVGPLSDHHTQWGFDLMLDQVVQAWGGRENVSELVHQLCHLLALCGGVFSSIDQGTLVSF